MTKDQNTLNEYFKFKCPNFNNEYANVFAIYQLINEEKAKMITFECNGFNKCDQKCSFPLNGMTDTRNCYFVLNEKNLKPFDSKKSTDS